MKLFQSVFFSVIVCIGSAVLGYDAENTFQSDASGAINKTLRVNAVAKVENEQSDDAVLVNVDRSDRIYQEGEKIVVDIQSSTDGYLYLVNIDASNEAVLLVPNRYWENNEIKANQKVVYPAKDMPFELEVCGPTFGNETIKAFVTKEKLKSLDNEKCTQNAATPLSEEDNQRICDELFRLTGSRKAIKVKPTSTLSTGSVKYKTTAKSETRTTAKRSKRYAIIIGINQYSDTNINPLEVCINDANAFKRLCLETLGIKKDDIVVLTDQEVTLERIRHIFCDVMNKHTQPGDTIFFYWSGHGGVVASTDATTSGSTDQYLVTYDGKLNDPYNTMLMENAFGSWVTNLNGRNIIMFLDACHSGGMARNAKSISSLSYKSKGLSDLIKGNQSNDDGSGEFNFTFGFNGMRRSKSLGQTGLYFLASSTFDQISYEGNNLSVMTNYLISTIQNGPDDMTHKDLKAEIKPQVEQYVQKIYRVRQTVVEQDDLNPGFVLKP